MKTSHSSIRTLIAIVAIASATALASPAFAQSGSRGYQRPATRAAQQQQQVNPQQQLGNIAASNQTELGLDGYCPVCVINSQKWVKGNANFSAVHDGKTYFFPGTGPRQEFINNPAKYAPALGGDCTVCYAKANKRVPGSVKFASLHNDRLFLFPSQKERDLFNRSPKEYENVDLALEGNCIVCQVKAGKDVGGDAQFTAIHNGFRYQFPSAKERQAFLQSPAQFVDAVSKPMMQNKEMSMMKHDNMKMKSMTSQVRFSGKTACAACEFGITPLGAPDELGLAVTTNDGKVYVIEEGHTRWPQVYKQRFDGQAVSVSGTVLKTAGNVTWIKPSQLTTL